jgi:hypothetical protein
MTKLLALTLCALTFIAILFLLATHVWAGMIPVWHFVGAALLGVIYPLGTWAIARRYPQTEGLAWGLLLIMMVWLIILAVLCQLLIPPMPRLELEDLMPPP